VTDWFPQRERAFAIGLFNAGANVGAIITPLLVPALVVAFGWRSAFFVTGLLGLTRYAAAGDDEIRFSVSGGGGVKLMPARRVGVRLDGRVFATFAYVDAQVLACGPGICLTRLYADIVWQAEFSAGLVVAFP